MATKKKVALTEDAIHDICESLYQTHGFTFSVRDGIAERGFAVSLFPELEHKIPMDGPYWRTNISLVEDYINEHIDLLSHPGIHAGGWWTYGGEEYVLYLDIVALCPNQRAAEWLCRKYHQLAFYNIQERRETRVEIGKEELLERLKDVPEVKRYSLYHLSRDPVLGRLDGSRRGENGHGEAGRVAREGSVPGSYFYELGSEPEGMIKHRPWISYLVADLAIADINNGVALTRIVRQIGAGRGEEYRNMAERAMQDMGYDGYRNENKFFIFGDVEVSESRRKK